MQEGLAAESSAELLEFVTRVLAFSGEEPSVMVGEVPDSLDLPLPPDAVIIGSVTSPDRDHGMVILDVPGSPQEAVSSITSELETAGWQQDRGPRSRGFQPSEPLLVTFCKGDEQGISVSVKERGPQEPADVRLTLGSGASCGFHGPRESSQSSLLPQLRPPDGASQIPVTQGGGGGTGLATLGHAQMASLVGTTMAATSLEEYYRAQLLEQDWELLTTNTDEGAAWSFWHLTDEEGQDWAATLVVTNIGDLEDFRAAWIQVVQADWEAEGPGAPPFR